MAIQLNIGLCIGSTGVELDAADVMAFVSASIPHVLMFQVANSGTEPTLVVRLPFAYDTDALRFHVTRVANALRQYAIAYYSEPECGQMSVTTDAGYLLGDEADKWGTFDMSKFIMFKE